MNGRKEKERRREGKLKRGKVAIRKCGKTTVQIAGRNEKGRLGGRKST